jgi:DNA polymerase-3 subunit alpha
VSYLVGITQIDPMPYNLLFERFYNAGRNSDDHISYPDIDMDVPVAKREAVIEYIKKQYGSNKVSQMITFQTMQGRAALKDVFKAYADMSNDDINRITSLIPDPSKVAGELQHMKEETGESSLIRFALEEKGQDFADWGVGLDKYGNVTGPLGARFEQAMRLEGTKIIQSKHAAGVVISPEPLEEYCPMVYDTKKKIVIAGMEMNDLEALGMLKFDILGIAMLDKIMGVRDILETGDIRREAKQERVLTDYDYEF